MDNYSNIKETDILIRYLAQEVSNEEQQIVQTWLESSLENRNYFDKLKLLWEDSNDTNDLDKKHETLRSWKKIQNITNEKTNKSLRIIRRVAVAASFLVVVGLSGYYFYFNNKEIKITSSRKIVKVTLPDASVVWLNRNSELFYKKNYTKNRTLRFSGEGYFEVQADASNPFMVITKRAIIKVLGTKFNVHAYPEDSTTEVVVKKGKVMLSPLTRDNKEKQTEIILTEGEKGIDNNNTVTPEKRTADDPNYLSWKTREFVFNNTNITEIVKIINNIYDVNIELKTENTENCNLSGNYSCQSLEDILDMLRIVLNIEIEKNGKNIIIKNSRC
jgi:transmembrane sensor